MFKKWMMMFAMGIGSVCLNGCALFQGAAGTAQRAGNPLAAPTAGRGATTTANGILNSPVAASLAPRPDAGAPAAPAGITNPAGGFVNQRNILPNDFVGPPAPGQFFERDVLPRGFIGPPAPNQVRAEQIVPDGFVPAGTAR